MSISISEYESDVELFRVVHLFVVGTVMLTYLILFIRSSYYLKKTTPIFCGGFCSPLLLSSDNCCQVIYRYNNRFLVCHSAFFLDLFLILFFLVSFSKVTV